MPIGNLALSDDRREDRDEVHYRTRAIHADGRSLQLLVVNISPHGFMARCESPLADGDAVRVMLPGLNNRAAKVRWALGGRIGAQFDSPVPLAHYYELLAILMR
ncbi:PilZ domain-containing protein [Sphingomonas donggukensis]|uniref:PilZ domain-containing protein n=1 Tax=Sphingomonas donggukensis TaxID=2949093 RepID=A0ABY4TXH9_9SPHN|nr:PilZ domain-containing protein [Sphingomonas donggukensis]URW77129.1 PilZ domain-containing protein [Sphingomonas donggukensis]